MSRLDMIGLVLVSHGQMSKYLLESAELIVGTQENVATVCLLPEESPEGFRAKMISAIDSLHMSDGILVLSDLCGGTPFNVTAVLSREYALECLTGVNLPMLLEIFMARDTDVSLQELVGLGEKSGKEGIVNLLAMLEQGE